MFPRKLAALVILTMMFSNIALFSMMEPTQAQLFTDNMIQVDPADVNVSYNTDFSLTVTNLLNESVWIFCLADANISRIDAPVFLTINASESYVFQFTSPQNPNDVSTGDNFDNVTTVTDFTPATPTYSIYFGCVNYAATTFQTVQITLTMTSMDSLTMQLSQLYAQNRDLMKTLLSVQDKAGMNNTLIVATVISNVFWACLLIGMKIYKPKNQNLLTDNSNETSIQPPHS